MSEYPAGMIRDLLQGRLSSEEIGELQRQAKDRGRLDAVVALEQERLGWADRILVPLQEHLFLVEHADGTLSVRCDCGHGFGDPRVNWKEAALVLEREPGDGRVYRGPRAADPDWTILREFYCPGCATQLDVEVVPRGYPFVFNFEPDVDGYRRSEAERSP